MTVTASATLIDKESASITSGLSNEQISALPVGQEYRDLIKLIPAVQYTQDTDARPERRRQRPGQRLPVRRRQRHAAALRHAVGRAGVARHRAGHRRQGRRAGGGLRSLRRLLDRLGQQVGHEPLHRPGQLPVPERGAWRRSSRAARVALRGGPQLARPQRRRPDRRRTSCSSTARTTAPRTTRNNRANLYGALPQYESTRNEGFGKLTFTPTHSMLVNVSYRDSKRVDTERPVRWRTRRRRPAAAPRARQKIGTADGSWVINASSFATFKYTHFANLTRGRPDNIANVTINTALGTQARYRQPRHARPLTVPLPIDRATAFNAFIQPLIDRYGYVVERRPDRRRHGRLRQPVRQRRFLPRRRSGRLQPASSAAPSPHDSTSATSGTSTRRI